MEAIIRLTIFLSVLALMVGWEVARPKRQPRYNRWQRWPANLGIVVIDTLVTRLLVPAGVVGAALWAQQQGVGLFNMLQVPAWLAVVASFMVLESTKWVEEKTWASRDRTDRSL